MKRISLLLVLSIFLLGFSVPTLAEKGKGHAHKDHKEKSAPASENDDVTLKITFGADDRDVIKSYLKKKHSKSCPPGLAKKSNGCLPPGIAKKYRVGYPLPGDIVFTPIPRDLLDLLGPAPRGHAYVQVDKDVLLIGEATKKVVDAVTLLSAVGR